MKKEEKCDFETHAISFITMWKNQFNITDLDRSMFEKHIQDKAYKTVVLKDMIEFCQERNLRPALVIPPIHPSLSKRLSPTFKENYIYSFIREANTSNVPFYDFMDSREFQEDEYFSNSFFMNEEGAKKFTQAFLHEINIMQN